MVITCTCTWQDVSFLGQIYTTTDTPPGSTVVVVVFKKRGVDLS